MIADYKTSARKSLRDVQGKITMHLLPFFGERRRMSSITTPDIRRFIAERQDAGVEAAEINRELAALRRSFNLAVQAGRLMTRPHFPMLKERNTRRGFLDRDQTDRICAALEATATAKNPKQRASELANVVRFAYVTGSRTASEVLPLEWRHVDWPGRCVRLDAHTTKNDEGRVFPFTADLEKILTAQLTIHKQLKAAGTICPFVFHRNGERIGYFRTAWKNACKAAGCPGALVHDMRRSAVRTFERAGVPRSVAMSIGAVPTDILHFPARVVVTAANALRRTLPIVLEELSGMRERVPRSTARGWLGKAPEVVVSLDVTDLSAPALHQEVLELRRRVKKLTALLRLALVLLRCSGFELSHERLPDGRTKSRILRAVDRAREYVPLRAVLRFLRLSPSRFHAWRRLELACALDDQSSCPHTSPHRLTSPEVRAIRDMVTAPEYRHVPTGTLAVLAQRLGTVWASPSTWYRLVRQYGWRRPRLRVHPAKPKIGLRTTRPDEMWHIDTTVIRLLDGTRAYLHAVIDNFSRRILAWRVADTCAPVNSVAVLVDASRGATPSATTPVVLADAGVENVNAHIDDLITTGVLRRVLAFTELTFSNSMIEAWWRSLKHQKLFLHSLDSVTTVRRLVAFYVDEHNRVLPHSAFRGQTPDEMYFGTGSTVPADLTSRAAAARRRRVEANRSASCEKCPSVDAAA